jgi:hypothetical protein
MVSFQSVYYYIVKFLSLFEQVIKKFNCFFIEFLILEFRVFT